MDEPVRRASTISSCTRICSSRSSSDWDFSFFAPPPPKRPPKRAEGGRSKGRAGAFAPFAPLAALPRRASIIVVAGC